MAVYTKNVVLALMSGLTVGGALISGYNPFLGFARGGDTFVYDALQKADQGLLLFTWFMSGIHTHIHTHTHTHTHTHIVYIYIYIYIYICIYICMSVCIYRAGGPHIAQWRRGRHGASLCALRNHLCTSAAADSRRGVDGLFRRLLFHPHCRPNHAPRFRRMWDEQVSLAN
jgi:hypothetical protein